MKEGLHEATTKLEAMGASDEYIQGWQEGFLQNPKREEQRLTEAYEAGYADGEANTTDNAEKWKA